ncbi:MAG TPA: hypothetical protein VIO94_03280 [Phenylobacterium sp.]
MKVFGISVIAVLMAIVAASAEAQTQGQHKGGAGHGMGPGGGGMGMHMGAQSTPGWSMMTPEERQEHMTKMRSFTTAKDCRAYVAQHHALMAERAKRQGSTMPAEPPRDPCAGLK